MADFHEFTNCLSQFLNFGIVISIHNTDTFYTKSREFEYPWLLIWACIQLSGIAQEIFQHYRDYLWNSEINSSDHHTMVTFIHSVTRVLNTLSLQNKQDRA